MSEEKVLTELRDEELDDVQGGVGTPIPKGKDARKATQISGFVNRVLSNGIQVANQSDKDIC